MVRLNGLVSSMIMPTTHCFADPAYGNNEGTVYTGLRHAAAGDDGAFVMTFQLGANMRRLKLPWHVRGRPDLS